MRSTLLLSIATPIILLLFIARHTGSPGGATGSPGDGMTCGVSGCHGVQTPQSANLVEALVPLSGYAPDSVYTVIVSLAREGIDRYGFELVAEDGNNARVGTFADNSRVSAWESDRRATHRSTSIDSTGENGWEVQWKAPAAGTGEVRFYAAVLAANGNGTNSGDSVFVGSFAVQEDVTTTSIGSVNATVDVFPNPLRDQLRVFAEGVGVNSLILYDLQGKSWSLEVLDAQHDVSFLPDGLYFLEIQTDRGVYIRRLVKQ